MAWEDISDVLTEDGLAKLTPGQVLVFDYEGSRNEYKVMRIRNGKCWVKQVTLYRPEDVTITKRKR